MIVRLSRKALADIEAIGDCIARDDRKRAATYVRELNEKCRGIGRGPTMYPLLSRYEADGVRRRLHRPYLIFYRIDPEYVVVLRVLHSATDYETILFPA